MSDNHGNTPAAWTAVVIALVGFVVGGIGLMFSPINMILFWIGVRDHRGAAASSSSSWTGWACTPSTDPLRVFRAWEHRRCAARSPAPAAARARAAPPAVSNPAPRRPVMSVLDDIVAGVRTDLARRGGRPAGARARGRPGRREPAALTRCRTSVRRAPA